MCAGAALDVMHADPGHDPDSNLTLWPSEEVEAVACLHLGERAPSGWR